jgi:hypothetical protein
MYEYLLRQIHSNFVTVLPSSLQFSTLLVIVYSTSNVIQLLEAFSEALGQFWMKGSLVNISHCIPVPLQIFLLCCGEEDLLHTCQQGK